MSLFHVEEHTPCHHAVLETTLGFKLVEMKAGDIALKQNNELHYMLFLLTGQARIACEHFPVQKLQAGHVILIPKFTSSSCEVLADSKFVVAMFERPTNPCVKSALVNSTPQAKTISHEFKSLEIRTPLTEYLSLLALYLQKGLNCPHLHELKMRELFLVIRSYYKMEERIQFFYPLIGATIDFREKVMSNYMMARKVKDLAQICGFSERVFNRRFNEEFGESPYKWMLKQVGQKVKERLTETDMPLKNIVDEFHFNSSSHFNSYCKTQFCKTPAQIRRESDRKEQ